MLNIKREFLKNIAALKIINSESFSKLKNFNLNDTLFNNQNDTFYFLIELIKILVGWEEIKRMVINFLSYHLITVENLIKILLKKTLNSEFLCNTNPLIPDVYINEGIYVSLKQVDFFKILKISPQSETGKFVYGSESLDLNAFLYEVINSTEEQNWKSILNISYVTNNIVDGTNTSDVLKIRIDESYRGKPILTFINNFIDSIALLSLSLLINRIFDNLFGVFSLKMGKDFDQIKKEEQFNKVIEKIINEPDGLFDNSYFNFTVNEANIINEKVRNTLKGSRYLNHCNEVLTQPDEDILSNLTNILSNSTEGISGILSDNFTLITNHITKDIPDKSKNNSVLEFYSSFFKGIIIGIVNILFSPKTMLMFSIYFKIVNNTIGFVDLNDFLSKNRQLLVQIIKNIILPILLKFIVNNVIKYLKKLGLQEQLNKNEEQAKYQQLQYLSLIGVPNNIADTLNNF